jgi:hypothetical protein
MENKTVFKRAICGKACYESDLDVDPVALDLIYLFCAREHSADLIEQGYFLKATTSCT